MKTVVWTENASWEELLSQAGQEDVLVLRDGHPMVLMTPFGDDDLVWYTREYDPGFRASLAEARLQLEQVNKASRDKRKKQLDPC